MLKHKKGLFRDNQKVIRNKEWYNQRFDGCLNFMWIISELEINKEKRKMDKGSFSSHVCVVKDGRADWYIEMDDIKRITDMFLSKLKTSNALGKKIMKKWENDEELFRQFISNLEKSVLTKASDKELKELYYEFLERYKKAISCSSLIDGFALGSDEIVQKEVEKLLDKRGIGKGRGETFSLLTAPVHQSFVNEAELSLLKIALEVKKFRDKTKAWKDEKIKKMISKHRDNYFWVNNNFFDSHDLNKSYFVRKIKAIVSSKVNIKEEIAKIKNTSAVNKRKKEALINKLKPSKYLKNLLEISEDFTNWQDERKKRTLFFTHYSNMFLQEMSKRFKLELEHLKGLSHSEICDMLEGKQFSLKELKDRSKTIIAYQKGNNYEVISGDRAEKVVANIFKKDSLDNINDFRGLTASTGVVRGVVKVVTSVKDIDKVKEGDVLVAVMTRPDYIAGMKKASAIVTNEGGITCHAAIVAREIGIPCIIGTKIATKVLKDGDMVEVNANHSWVRKI